MSENKTNDLSPNLSNKKDNVQYGMFKIGDTVEQEFNMQIMRVIGFEPELIENVITQWEDEMGNTIVGKFTESELKIANSK